jgi:hypothetical protein
VTRTGPAPLVRRLAHGAMTPLAAVALLALAACGGTAAPNADPPVPVAASAMAVPAAPAPTPTPAPTPPFAPMGLAELLQGQGPGGTARPAQDGDALRGGAGGRFAVSRAVAVAALLPVDEEPRGDDGVFALVLAERGQRAEALCTATLERLDLVDLEQGARPRFARRPVFWMVTPTASEVAGLRDVSCQELALKLDGQRAQAHGLGAEAGPVLLGFAERGTQIWRMAWDLSAIPVSEFPRATRIWTELLAGEPAEWEARSSRVQWREATRGFLIRFGEPLEGLVGARPARAEAAPRAPRYVIVR